MRPLSAKRQTAAWCPPLVVNVVCVANVVGVVDVVCVVDVVGIAGGSLLLVPVKQSSPFGQQICPPSPSGKQ